MRERGHGGKKEHSFVIELPHRHHVIAASSPEQKDEWMAEIAKILLGLGKDPNAKSKPAASKTREQTASKKKSKGSGMFSSWIKQGLPDAPDVELPDAEVPEIDVDVPEAELPDVEVPDVDVNIPTTEVPDIKVPDVDGTLPDAELPGVDVAAEETAESVEEAEAIEEIVRTMTVSQAGKEVPAEIIREGEMFKTGGMIKSWKARWFVMYAKSIAYLDKKGGKVKGGILLEDANLVSRLRVGCGCCGHGFSFPARPRALSVRTLASRALFDGAGADPSNAWSRRMSYVPRDGIAYPASGQTWCGRSGMRLGWRWRRRTPSLSSSRTGTM